MCGIHLTIATVPVQHIPLIHHVEKESTHSVATNSSCELGVSPKYPEWLTRRGTDGTGRVDVVQTYVDPVGRSHTDESDESSPSLTSRVTLQASVLRMRQDWMPQPVVIPLTTTYLTTNGTPAASSSTAHLAWNGEIYQLLVDEETHPNSSHIRNVSDDQTNNGCCSRPNLVLQNVDYSAVADTTLVAELVQRALQTLPVVSSHHDDDDDNDNLSYNLERMQATARHLVTQIWNRVVNAEYAFCILTDHAVYYGRDSLGRRSLLEASSSLLSVPHMGSAEEEQWYLSSVASLNRASSDGPPPLVWTEVKPGVVHGYDWKSHYRIQEPICVLPTTQFLESPISIPPTVCAIEVPNVDGINTASLELRTLLQEAVRRRCHHSLQTDNTASTVAVLFSGGLDSAVVAALALECGVTYVTLLTVSFVDATGVGEINFSSVASAAADATAAQQSYIELQARYPLANIELVHHVVDWEQVSREESRIRQLIHPKTTVMDLNIATALWFAASASSTPTTAQPWLRGRVLLSGLGADELLGGYGRHRKAWEHGGNDALRDELDLDLSRLWERNLGRDDRVLSDTSQEVRFPFLDTTVMSYVQQLSLDLVVDYTLPPGVGDKRILRLVAHTLGLSTAAVAVKRAIQFGSRIAHVSDKRRFGSRRKATGESKTT